jgi:hypothetical protein
VGVYLDCGREDERETAPQHPHPTPASILAGWIGC